MTDFLLSPLQRNSQLTLVDQLMHQLISRIEQAGLRAGTRLPSIRHLALQLQVSRFTVVEAYERLVAKGLVESRRGSGYFVAHQRQRSLTAALPASQLVASQMDTQWLLRSSFREMPEPDMPGSGSMPSTWLDAELIARSVRAVSRHAGNALVSYGNALGYLPLRQEIALRLQIEGIGCAQTSQVLLTTGVTHALDLIIRHLIKPGDTVLVEDPGWFLIFARLATFGANVVGVPRGPDGPDLVRLAELVQRHQPKLFLINTAVHNPTGYSLSAGAAYEILRIAEQHKMWVVEDDTYSELHPGNPIRLAALDQLRRVIHVGGFSKTLAPSLRVGYIAASVELIQGLSDLKVLIGLTSSELSERVVHNVLSGGHYRLHLDRLRMRLDKARDSALSTLAGWGVQVPVAPTAGMFVWGDCGCDSELLTRMAAEQALLLAPGRLFSPTQLPSTWMRFSVSALLNPQVCSKLTGLFKQLR